MSDRLLRSILCDPDFKSVNRKIKSLSAGQALGQSFFKVIIRLSINKLIKTIRQFTLNFMTAIIFRDYDGNYFSGK